MMKLQESFTNPLKMDALVLLTTPKIRDGIGAELLANRKRRRILTQFNLLITVTAISSTIKK